MKIELINYSGNRVECEIPEKEEILAAFIEVRSGGEVVFCLHHGLPLAG